MELLYFLARTKVVLHLEHIQLNWDSFVETLQNAAEGETQRAEQLRSRKTFSQMTTSSESLSVNVHLCHLDQI